MPRSDRHIIVVGGGLAGVAAATLAAERGIQVTLLEKLPYLGGRLGAWDDSLMDGTTFQMERGFHAFFRQYYNLRALLRRIDPHLSFLQPVADYPLMGPDGMKQSFQSLPKQTPWNVAVAAWRTPGLDWRALQRVNGRAALAMLAFDPSKTYQRFDDMSARSYLDSLRFPEDARGLLFDIFAHSFFNPEEELSAAELLMMFHFYFTGNQEGLLFDVCRQPFSKAIWNPMLRYLESKDVRVELSAEVQSLQKQQGQQEQNAWQVSWRRKDQRNVTTDRADAVVLATTVPGLQALMKRSAALYEGDWKDTVDALAVTRPFAVWRMWLDGPMAKDRPPFAGTRGVGMLDNISLYHLFEDESRGWSGDGDNSRSVVELHAYALPQGASEKEIRKDLWQGLISFYPEAATRNILEDRFLLLQDCPAFAPGSARKRPRCENAVCQSVFGGRFRQIVNADSLNGKGRHFRDVGGQRNFYFLVYTDRANKNCGKKGNVRQMGSLALGTKAKNLLRKRGQMGFVVLNRTKSPLQANAMQADVAWIQSALARSQRLSGGGWYVIDARQAVGTKPRRYRILDRDLVVWNNGSGFQAAPDSCPHMQASLADGCLDKQSGELICPWHGLRLGRNEHIGWKPFPTFDDGVLLWVQIADEEEASGKPSLVTRPAVSLDGVIRVTAACRPEHVMANRLDPWHGVHFHPYSFGSS